jgi:uncharacterized membrane protein
VIQKFTNKKNQNKLPNQIMKQKIFYCAFSLFASIVGCTYEKEDVTPPATDVCATTPASFTKDVHVIFQTNCAKSGCHNAASASGGVVLETYDQIISKINRIEQRALIEKSMPPTGPLPAKDVNIIQCWINAGTPNN